MKRIKEWMLPMMVLFAACNGSAPVPKPRGYLRTDFPEKNYLAFDTPGFPYSFRYPDYATVEQDRRSYRFAPFWINLQMPAYNATLHLTYQPVRNNLPDLLEDTYKFVYRHVIKADEILETPFRNEAQKTHGFLYEIGGDVASSVQFYMTDSTRHFLRGSLYFMATPNVDSLSPAIVFLTADIRHLMQTLEWRNGKQ
ncbi:MAG: gliding motility lipoprotein GldD [Prevotellaceae bacterium]|jgi:gliding motility-associated lipoprotein GldD|nr:gliding motility lipoprotein GldD [Prevotellaceae bacterium]